MQLTGDRFTQETASFGNDLSTLPELPGRDPRPPGHPARRLVVPGALRRPRHPHPRRPPRRAGRDEPGRAAGQPRRPAQAARRSSSTPHDFTARNLTKAGYADNPLEDDSLAEYAVHAVDLTGMTVEAVKEFGLSRKDAARAKNMFALGLRVVDVRPARPRRRSRSSSAGSPRSRRSATRTSRRSAPAGTSARPPRRSSSSTRSSRPRCAPGTYRNITGNLALSYGLVAGAVQSGLPLFLGSYPITPASDILHELSKHKRFGVTTFQAEDEIAGIGAALGASFAGALGVTTTSGPGRRAEVRDDRPRGDDRAAAASSSTSSAAGPRPGCRPRPSRPTCCRRCSAATARRRCRSSRRSRPATASTPRSRRPASRSPTAPR